LTTAAQRMRHLEAENQNLRGKLDEVTKASQQQHTARLSGTEEKILLLLTNNDRRISTEIASRIGISVDRAEAMLDDLREAGLVCPQAFIRLPFEPSRPTEWFLTNDGKRYLVRHNLIQ
jgi:predicted ArsR family transcriptional regulator